MVQANEMGWETTYYLNTATYGDPTWTEINFARDASFNRAPDKQEATLRKHARLLYKSNLIGLKDFMITLEMLKPPNGDADATYDDILAAFLASTSVDILRVKAGILSTDGLAATRAICGVFNGNEVGGVGGAPATQTFEFAPVHNSDADGPVEGTMSSSDFVPAS